MPTLSPNKINQPASGMFIPNYKPGLLTSTHAMKPSAKLQTISSLSSPKFSITSTVPAKFPETDKPRNFFTKKSGSIQPERVLCQSAQDNLDSSNATQKIFSFYNDDFAGKKE